MTASNCIRCEDRIDCSKDLSCWCTSLPNILSPTEGASCYCKPCLIVKLKEKTQQLIDAKKFKHIASLGPTKKAVQELDYEINEMGNVVFTKWYHLRRGICCGSGCVNCPYGHTNVV